MTVPHALTIAALGWLGYQIFKRGGSTKARSTGTRRPPADTPPLHCGLYPWKPSDVDAVLEREVTAGELDLETLALRAAREVYPSTPEGEFQPWPPASGDARALCILDRIRIRVNLKLAQVADDSAKDDEEPGSADPTDPGNEPWIPQPLPAWPTVPQPPGPQPPGPTPAIQTPSRPEEPPLPPPKDPAPPDDPEDPGDWPEGPPPGPVNLERWTDPGNYPTPGKFHQVGGPNSGTTLTTISKKALTTAFYLIHGDLDLAVELAGRSENWRAYREALNCCPWNHALYGARHKTGTAYFYETPHGDQISLNPVHANVAAALTDGEPPERRVREDNPQLPSGGRHALLWLPMLDEAELAEGRVVVKHGHWWTGDWLIMPPPEVLALGVVEVSPDRVWGCGEYETQYAFVEDGDA